MFSELRNLFDFYIRTKTKFSRKNFTETDFELIERNRLENEYTKEVLNKYFSKPEKTKIKILDIGSKNWFYAKGEYEYFKSICRDIELDGIELDAYRLYNNLYSRYEVAKYYTKGLKETRYIADNLLNLERKYDYIVWILPFVLLEPHRYWGLPRTFFYPERLLSHAYSLLNPKGEMLIINQGKVEKEAQENMLNKLGINYRYLGEIESEHYKYQHKRYGFLVKK